MGGGGPDGTFKTSPMLRAQAYTAHAHFSGFGIPCLHDLLPDKTAATYAAKWAAIRANIAQEASDVDRLVEIDFEVAAVGAESAAFHGARFACFYFHLGRSVYRQVQKLGLLSKYAAEAEFQLRANMISAYAFLPVDDVAAGFQIPDPLFADDEQAI